MRTIYLLPLALLTACAHNIPMTPAQTCASRGLKVATATTLDEVTCAPAETKADQCRIDGIKASIKDVEDFNSTIANRRTYVGLGFMAFIVPGFIIKSHYSTKAEEIQSESRELEKKISCGPST